MPLGQQTGQRQADLVFFSQNNTADLFNDLIKFVIHYDLPRYTPS
jgi:hypothetical protein